MTEKTVVQQTKAARYFNLVVNAIDDILLGAVAIGTISVAIGILYELSAEFAAQAQHNFPHVVSDLMFVLIIMELFRQVMRQINHEPFSLNPFMSIGVIASVRGLLILQMKVGEGEIDWNTGTMGIIIHAITVLILILALYLYNKPKCDSSNSSLPKE